MKVKYAIATGIASGRRAVATVATTPALAIAIEADNPQHIDVRPIIRR